ncbi:Mannose-6-phosphate receptor, binding protein [Niveomyces insectorum RCEF 264]|uniref:Glucosidase 2 subunit beta n=1 Tax=Niveomyces insectorum RCEF 264 TaxID=1081102 RepID=A0A162J902_9HYPO|nr:Mannose-6-phosphate receptor, binding protein [Niveomyces insectorum RCEF 264]
MRQTRALLLAGAIASSNVAVAASLPRGVSPEFAKYFEAKGKFTCINNPSIVLEARQVNDNTCDCPDGSDEPGTSACSYIDPLSPPQPLPGSPSGTTNTTAALPGFWCANVGHIGAYVPFSYVNDGVCDYDLCCDGSEEYSRVGGVKCENRCVAIGKEHRRVEEERKKAHTRAAKRRRALLEEGQRLRTVVQERIQKARGEIRELEQKRDRLQQELAETERAEKGKVFKTGRGRGKAGGGGKLGVLVGLAKQRVAELRDTLDKVLDQRDDLRDKVDELETILRNLQTQYNPNFNDEGVKAAVHAWEDYAAKGTSADDESKPAIEDADVHAVLKEDSEENGINWTEFETDDVSDTDILYSFEAYLPASLRGLIHEKLGALRAWLVANGVLADKGDGPAESPAVKAAREAVQAVQNDLIASQNTLDADHADLEKDYGRGDIFRPLTDRCVSTEDGEYEYEVCWMAQATQKSKKGHGNTGLGHFSHIDVETADDEERLDGKSLGRGPRMVLRYENGQHCWNGPNRRTDVWLGCAEKDEVWRVMEAEKCVYKMEVGTPAACDDDGGDDNGTDAKTGGAKAHAGKDEL